jgi:hypothetical protein
MKIKRLTSFVAAFLLSLTSMFAVYVPQAHAAIQTCAWTGAINTSFGTAGNWTGCGGSVPLNGDIIKFKQLSTTGSGTQYNLTNNLSGSVRFSGIIIDVTQTTANIVDKYSMTGVDGLQLATGATITTTGTLNTETFQSGATIFLTGFHAYGDLTIDENNTRVITYDNETIGTVDGNLIIATGGHLDNANGVKGTVTGNVQVNGSITASTELVAASISVGSSGYLTFTHYGTDASVATSSSSVPLNLNGGVVTWYPGSYYSGSWQYPATTYTMSGNITLTADSTVLAGSYGQPDVTVNLTGTITKNDHKLLIGSSNRGAFKINGAVYRNEVKETSFADSKPNCGQGDNSGCYTTVDNETVILDGARGAVTLSSGSTLKGTGTVGTVFANNNAILAPGHSPGKLTILALLTLTNGAIYQAELQSKTNYDKLQVGDASITAGHAVILGDASAWDGDNYPTAVTGNPILQVSIFGTGTIAKTDTFTIIDNLSKTSVLGVFKDLPEGATFPLNGGVMKITYVGGDGNDVVLSVVTVPTVANTGFKLILANAFIILPATIAVAGAVFYLLRRRTVKS